MVAFASFDLRCLAVFRLTILQQESLLREVHDPKNVLAVLLGVADSEVEPLLVSSSVGVHLHIELVLSWINDLRL